MASFDPVALGVCVAAGAFGGAVLWLVRRIRRNKLEYAHIARERAEGRYGLQFVHIEEDGSARELEPHEVAYLNTEFIPGDSGRPYIKGRYTDLTPDGKIWGFLPRSALPPDVRVKTLAEQTPMTTPQAAIAKAAEQFTHWLGPEGASPDGALVVTLSDGVWRVVGDWTEAGGGLYVEISAASGRIMSYGVTSGPRSTPLRGGRRPV